MDYNSLSTGETVLLQNAYNPRGDYGLSEFDVRHRFVLSGFYELPLKANRAVIFNHPNFGDPVLTTTSSFFGEIRSTRFPTGGFGSSRQIQFALKLGF